MGLMDSRWRRRLEDIRVEIRKPPPGIRIYRLAGGLSALCQRLFELIGARVPHVRHDHTVESLSANPQYFKYVPRRPLTPQLEQALAPLVQLDDIVYQEGRDLYTQRWGRIADVGGYRSL